MHVVPFIAESALDAVAQIRAKLGPEAVVLNVRKLPPNGMAKFWRKPRIEVLACLPSPNGNGHGESRKTPAPDLEPVMPDPVAVPAEPERVCQPFVGRQWRVGPALERLGLLPLHAHQVVDMVRAAHGDVPPRSIGLELDLAGATLKKRWKPAGEIVRGATHVLVGEPGVGKTTVLCKWLTRAVLLEDRPCRVWRLDGGGVNSAEWLNVHCEILGVPVERASRWEAAAGGDELRLVDLPGVNTAAVRDLAAQTSSIPGSQVHLVLNAAYDIELMLEQVRAFAPVGPVDLILTHLNEGVRCGKLWNLVLGTSLPVRFLAGGQSIPGDFRPASADQIWKQTMSLRSDNL